MPHASVSDAEWYVLQAVWQGHPASAEDIVRRLERRTHWHPRTVKTLIHRLVRKGALTFRKDGRRYLYSPALPRKASVRRALREFVDRVFGGAAAPAIVGLVEDARLTSDEVKQLRAVLDRKLDEKLDEKLERKLDRDSTTRR